MTPKRLAKIEEHARDNPEYPMRYTILDLIAHIRDLEAQLAAAREAAELNWEAAKRCVERGIEIDDLQAQLAAAREAIHEAKTKLEAIPGIDWNGITPFNGVWNVLHKADYATPPSSEVK